MLIQREGPFADTLRERAHRGSFEDFFFLIKKASDNVFDLSPTDDWRGSEDA